MELSDILTKTPKGTDEIKTRANKLPQKLRSLLIMIDGISAYGELAGRFSGQGDFDAFLKSLVDDGYVEVRGEASRPVPAAGRPAKPAVSVPGIEAATREEAVGILCRNLYDLIGPSADDFTGRLENADTREQFLAAVEACSMMVESFAGLKKAELFEARAQSIAQRFLPS